MDKNFLIKQVSENTISKEFCFIGFDEAYSKIAQNKYQTNLLKIFSLTPVQATILKQTALACGTDCALHRNVLTNNIEHSDVILFATNKQLSDIIKKLYAQPFGLKFLAKKLEEFKVNKLEKISIRSKEFNFKKTYLMGILNVTPNSFSDGGEFFDEKDAVKRFEDLVNQGADIIDIGAESTAPNSQPVDSSEEIARIENVLKICREKYPQAVISIDTRNAFCAKRALELGVDIVNDISGLLFDKQMAEVVAGAEAFVVLNFNDEIKTENTIDEVIKGLLNRIELAQEVGIAKEKIILDVGLGFNKTFEQNIELIKRAKEICSLGFPVLYGLSRKSFVQKISEQSPKETLSANISLGSYLTSQGVNILRVHDVLEHKIAFRALDRVLYD